MLEKLWLQISQWLMENPAAAKNLGIILVAAAVILIVVNRPVKIYIDGD